MRRWGWSKKEIIHPVPMRVLLRKDLAALKANVVCEEWGVVGFCTNRDKSFH
jgi:hypothetical protein